MRSHAAEGDCCHLTGILVSSDLYSLLISGESTELLLFLLSFQDGHLELLRRDLVPHPRTLYSLLEASLVHNEQVSAPWEITGFLLVAISIACCTCGRSQESGIRAEAN